MPEILEVTESVDTNEEVAITAIELVKRMDVNAAIQCMAQILDLLLTKAELPLKYKDATK
jgi:hypothetical protein